MADFRSVVTVEPVLFLYMLCAISSAPLLQQLAFKKICQENYGAETCKNLTKKQEDYVHSKTSKWILYQSVASTLPSIVTSLILGSWSDKVGRKVILLLPSIGCVLLYISLILNVVFFSLNVNYLLIGVFISGLFGGFTTTLLGVFSYISDVTDTTQRTLRVSILQSMVFLGGTVGNLSGEVLLQYVGYLSAFALALGLNILIIIYVFFVLRESYFPQEREENNLALGAVYNHIKSLFNVFIKERPGHQRLNIVVIMFGIFFFLILDIIGFVDVTVLYSKLSPRNFTPLLIGYLFAVVDVVKGVGSVLCIPVMTKLFHLSDLTITVMGTVIAMGSYAFFGIASSTWMMFLGGVFSLGDGIALPCVRSRLSKQVESTELGSMFALLASVEVLGTLLASVIFNSIYSFTVDWFPGFCYFVMSGLLVIALCLIVFLIVLEKSSNPYLEIAAGVQSRHENCSVNSDKGSLQSPTCPHYGSQDASSA